MTLGIYFLLFLIIYHIINHKSKILLLKEIKKILKKEGFFKHDIENYIKRIKILKRRKRL